MNNSRRRVVVTGFGAVSPLGNDFQTTWAKIQQGQSGVGLLTRRNLGDDFPVKVAGEVKDFDAGKFMDVKDARKTDRFVQYALAASLEAFVHAGVTIDPGHADRIGVWIGSGIGGMETFEEQVRNYDRKGYKRVSPFFVPMVITDIAAGQVAIRLGAKGPNGCSVSACASGANSVGEAYTWIQRGVADVMICGGAEAPITDLGLSGFHSMKALSTNPDPGTASRPFDQHRDGFVIAEGAGILVLEELSHALARNAHIYAEMVGYGCSGDAHHITAPDPEGSGCARAMAGALQDAGVTPDVVGYINAHGTSTEYNDKFETVAIKSVFADHAHSLAVSSTKSMTGHMLGAAGGIEAGFSAMALHDGRLPPTINYRTVDEACDLDYVPNTARAANVQYALSNSLGFGGHNVSLLFKRWDS